MILATRDDYEFPHIDWHCKQCDEVYCSAGVPSETRCFDGHAAGWRPESGQLEEYISILESLEPGDGVVLCGEGPAPLMGRVESVDDGKIVTENIDSPSRTVTWELDEDDAHVIEWTRNDREHEFYSDIHHVETVEIKG